MGAIGRDEADRGGVLEHGPETDLFHACGSRFHADGVKLGCGRHASRQDEPADHSRGQWAHRGEREGPAPAPKAVGPDGQQKRDGRAESEGGDIATHGEATTAVGEALRDHAHARHVGPGEPQPHGAAQDHCREKVVGPACESEARRRRPERAPEVDPARGHVVRQGRQDHDRADIAELVKGNDQPRLAVAERPLLLEQRQERGEVREDEERAELGGADGGEPRAIGHRLPCCSRHFLQAARRVASSFSSPRSTGR